jgi:DNA-nicking Smr family endonuclease
VEQDQTTRNAKRYSLLRDYLLKMDSSHSRKLKTGDQPFVMHADFHGVTFDQAVDALQQKASSTNACSTLFEFPDTNGNL